MSEHPIEGLMVTAMNSIQDMVDVNTIIGEPIETSNNIIIIPISKVSFGFAAGGSEFKGETVDEYTKKDKEEAIQYRLPFGGGSGAGVSINPIAFLVVQGNNVKLLPVNHSSSLDKLLDYVPELIEKANSTMNKCIQNKKEQTQEIVKEIQKNVKKEAEKEKEKIKEKREKIEKQEKQTRKRKAVKPPKEEDYEYEYEERNAIKDDEDELGYIEYDD
ncbi:MAG: GerW family sporulation protein [Clostridia bacterium]|nr:GerW family sporulation protein [Clostridia bacterium]